MGMTCHNTVGEGLRAAERLDMWVTAARRQHDALRRATAAAELALVLLAHMTDDQRAALMEDSQINYLVNAVSAGAYGRA